MGAELLDRQLHPAGIEVADQQLGADRRQLLGQCVADVAEPLHRDPQAFQVVAAEARLGAGANPGEHAEGGMRRGVAGLGGAGDVAGLLGDAVHVGAGGTAVHRSDVASAEAFDEAPEGLEQRAAIVQVRRADDHRLAAALLQPARAAL